MRITTILSAVFAVLTPVVPARAQNDPIDWSKVDIGAMKGAAQTELFSRSRESLAGDPHRPLYHFSSPGAMIHDASGLCFWRGRYHLFYQLHGGPWQCAKGHAISDDLVHWRDFPVAFAADRDYEVDKVMNTGQVLATENRVIMTYGTRKGMGLATASDDLLTDWRKHPANPVHPARGGPVDTCLWRENGAYHALMRMAKPEQGRMHSTLQWLRSEDLTAWEPRGVFVKENPISQKAEDLACANFVPFGDGRRLLLFFNHLSGPQYFIGTRNPNSGLFGPEEFGRMRFGSGAGSLHAPSVFIDPGGRCLAIWNITENRPPFGGWRTPMTGGWKGIMSLPRQLAPNKGKCNDHHPLRIEPVAELANLRFDPVKIGERALPANEEQVLAKVQGKAMEIETVIDPLEAREVGLTVFRSPGGEEQTTITLTMDGDSKTHKLALDVSRASLDPEVRPRAPEIGPLYLEEGEPLHLRVFIDRSVVEVFANGRQCLTLRAYPTREDSRGVSAFARGGDAKLISLTAWQMRGIWPELKNKEGK